MDKNIVAIIQARMGAERLPKKVLMDIEGRPMLWHVVGRLKQSKLIENIVVATTESIEDDSIESFCKEHSIDFYRGSEKNVLDRYYHAAKLYKANIVVRITADCPLVDHVIVDKVISGYLANIDNCKGACNIIRRTYPRGLDTEVISFSALEQAWKNVDKDYQREHVTAYMYEHPELFKIYSVENDRDLSHLRWTVDEEADLKFVREVYKRLYREKEVFQSQEVIELLERTPALININRGVEQKAIKR